MFDQCLYFNTTSLARLLEKQWAQAFKPFGLTPSQAFMLRFICANPNCLLKEIAIELHLSRPTVSRILDGLEKLSLIKRIPQSNDGREFAIQPTPIALIIHNPLNEAAQSVTIRLKQILGEDNFISTTEKLRRMSKNLKS